MTDRLALALVLVILAAFGADFVFNDGTGSFFLFRKMVAFIEFLAFWR